jgi:subtilisin family serine protease
MRLCGTGLAVAAAVTLVAAGPASAADPLRSSQWGLDMIESDAAHGTATGTGAVVAVIDSGVFAGHEDLQGRLLPGHDFVQKDDTPQDGHGHGTHVTGIVVAAKDNGKGVSSVAPGAVAMPLRVLDDNGEGMTSGVVEAIDYAIAHGAHVINLSLGSDVPLFADDPKLDAALARAAAAGVVIVAAAGNNSIPFCEQPSVQGSVLCVGAVDRGGMRSVFSSFPDADRGVMAPGGSAVVPLRDEDIVSTWNDGKYAYVAGTSQASPHVAGVAALLVSLGLRGKAVADRILATATDAGLPGPDDVYGHGIVNARAAVAGLQKPPGGGGSRAGKSSVASRHRTATVLKKGIRVSCRPAAAGRCSARVLAGSTTIAYGSAKTGAGQKVTVIARVTKAGRRLLERKAKVKARAEIAMPGSPTTVKKITIRR